MLPRSSQPAGDQFAEMKWPAVYQDEVLQGLIKEALANNYDMRIAATRILQANASLGITRANQFPTVNGSASVVNERNNFFPGAPTFDTIGIQLDYIVDFWGQYRRATEAARATLLATEFGRRIVQTTLISSVASNYFLLRQFDFQLDYSQRDGGCRQGNPEPEQHQVQGWRKCDYRRLSSPGAGATGRGGGHHPEAVDRAGGKQYQHPARPQPRSRSRVVSA